MIRIVNYLITLSISISANAKIDSLYIKNYPNKLLIKPFLSHNFINLSYNLPRNLPTLNLKPNNTFDLGISVGYKWIGIMYAYGLLDVGDEKQYGKSDYFDIRAAVFLKKNIADFTVQNYKGFYISNIGCVCELSICS
jgi:hypothetical protein